LKPLLLALVLLALALVSALFLALARPSTSPTTAGTELESASASELARLSGEIAALNARIDALERERRLDPGTPRTLAAPAAQPERAAAGLALGDPRWYLEQYVVSCADGGEGSEYFRLAVDAYVVDLKAPICELVASSARPEPLRAALARMLGRPRFRGDGEVQAALLSVLRDKAGEILHVRALEALDAIGDRGALPALEGLLFGLESKKARDAGLALVLKLAGDDTNGTLLRMFVRAPDDEWRQLLIRLLDGSDLDAALQLFVRASSMGQPMRLAGALKIGQFPAQEFRDFVADWVRIETDEEVLRALRNAQKQQTTIPNWHALKATGAPDADPRRDNPNAWASAQADMGIQWLELTYGSPTRAFGVRVYEVCSAGAVAEVRARNATGDWVSLWKGTASSNLAGPLWIEFPLTSFDVRTLRLVLDTDRTPNWNEIDAVELVGPAGGQWATHASASSTYGAAMPERLEGNGRALLRGR
jgi:hypothetical protein